MTPHQLRGLAEEYYATDFPGRRASTISLAKMWVEKWLKWMNACHHKQVTHESLQSYVNFLYEKFLPATAREYYGSVRRFLRWMERTCLIERSPHVSVRIPMTEKVRKVQPITREEYIRLREVAAGHWMDWVIMLGWNTGMSISDCMLLKWGNVDLDRCLITIRRIKTGTPSIIPFDPEDELGRALFAARESNPDAKPEDYVSRAAGMRVNLNSAAIGSVGKSAFRHISEAAKLPKGKSFHSFRHSFVSMLANSGMNTALATKVSGHLDPKVFARYVHVEPDSIRRDLAEARAKAGNIKEVVVDPLGVQYSTCPSYLWRPNTVYIVKRGRIKMPDGSDLHYVKSGDGADGKQAVVVPCDESGEPTSNMQLVVDIKDVSRFR